MTLHLAVNDMIKPAVVSAGIHSVLESFKIMRADGNDRFV